MAHVDRTRWRRCQAIVQKIAANPAVKDDYEGLGIYDLGDGRGYIVVSSQGNDTYAV